MQVNRNTVRCLYPTAQKRNHRRRSTTYKNFHPSRSNVLQMLLNNRVIQVKIVYNFIYRSMAHTVVYVNIYNVTEEPLKSYRFVGGASKTTQQ